MSGSYSQQQCPRKRRAEDISSFVPSERNPDSTVNFDPDISRSVNVLRHSSVTAGSSSLLENVERPTKRMISANAFPDNSGASSEVHVEPPSPENGSDFRQSLQIDMKSLVGDAVGNVRFIVYGNFINGPINHR